MPLQEVHTGLTAAGFTSSGYGRVGMGCTWTLIRSNEMNITIDVRKTDGAATACSEGSVVRELIYRRTDFRRSAVEAQQSGATLVAQLRDELGADTSGCQVDRPAPAQGKRSDCIVKFPRNAPAIGMLKLEYRASSISMPQPQAILHVHLLGADEQREIEAEVGAASGDRPATEASEACPPGLAGGACRANQRIREIENERSQQQR